MSTDPDPTRSAPSPAAHGRRYKRRELQLPDGGRLVLSPDGSIAQLDGDGVQTQAWVQTDPEWAGRAIRFGLYPQDDTVPPTGRVGGTWPPKR